MNETQVDASDPGVVRELYARLGRPALGKTMRLVEKSIAEEIVHDTFVKMWQAKMVFPNLRSAYAWVYRCCTNAAIDHLRSQQNTDSQGETDDFVADAHDLEFQTMAREQWKYLLMKLKPEEASLFVYRYLEGLSQEEAAEVMNISRRTVNRLQGTVDAKLAKVKGSQNVG